MTAPKSPSELAPDALLHIVEELQAWLFLDFDDEVDRTVWSLDKDVSGADFVEAMTGLLAQHGLAPEPEAAESTPAEE